MYTFRRHIVKWVINLLLTFGMVAHAAFPYSLKAQKTAFAQWLDRNVVSNGEDRESSIREHIKQLPLQYENFPLLIEQASQLVMANQNDFKLPIGKKTGSSEYLGQWLVEKWTQHQKHAGSKDALLPETVKPSPKWLAQHQPAVIQAHVKTGQNLMQPSIQLPGFQMLHVIQYQPIPFLSGTSINAP